MFRRSAAPFGRNMFRPSMRRAAITATIGTIRRAVLAAVVPFPFSLNHFAAKPSPMGRKFFGTDGIRGRTNVAPLTAEVASS